MKKNKKKKKRQLQKDKKKTISNKYIEFVLISQTVSLLKCNKKMQRSITF